MLHPLPEGERQGEGQLRVGIPGLVAQGNRTASTVAAFRTFT